MNLNLLGNLNIKYLLSKTSTPLNRINKINNNSAKSEFTDYGIMNRDEMKEVVRLWNLGNRDIPKRVVEYAMSHVGS